MSNIKDFIKSTTAGANTNSKNTYTNSIIDSMGKKGWNNGKLSKTNTK